MIGLFESRLTWNHILAPAIILIIHNPAVGQDIETSSPDNNQEAPLSLSEEEVPQADVPQAEVSPREVNPGQTTELDENVKTDTIDDAQDPPEEVNPDQTTESETTPPTEENTGPSWPSWIDMFKLKADLRYRFEIIDTDTTDLRYRHRLRVRVGLLATIYEDLDAFIGIGTGQGNDPKSNNQSLTDAFSSKPLWLDLAYVDWHPSFAGGLQIIAGKIKNPFYRVGKSELQWDPDLNPEGMSLNFRRTFGIVEPFVNTGAFFVEERKNDDDTWLLGVQAGIKFNFADGRFYFLVGAGYMDYLHIKGKGLLWDDEDSFGNSTDTIVDEDGNDIILYARDYNEVNTFAEIGGKIARFPWALFADFGLNTAADTENMGWLVGVSFGTCRESLDFALRYIYREIARDAVFGLHTDSDFAGGATGSRGQEVNFSFQIVKYVQFAATYFYNQLDMDKSQPYHRAQFDFKFKY